MKRYRVDRKAYENERRLATYIMGKEEKLDRFIPKKQILEQSRIFAVLVIAFMQKFDEMQ